MNRPAANFRMGLVMFLISTPAFGGTGDLIATQIETNGSQATLTFGLPDGGWGTPSFDPDPVKAPLFNVTGRVPQPDGAGGITIGSAARAIPIASIASTTVSGLDLLVTVNLSETIHVDDLLVPDVVTVSVGAGWITDGTNTSGAATDSSVTNGSGLSYPKAIARWATVPYQTYDGPFTLEMAAFSKHVITPGNGGIAGIEVSVTDTNNTTQTVYIDAPTEVDAAGGYGPAGQYRLFTASFDAIAFAAFAEGPATVRFRVYPDLGDAASVRESGVDDPADLPIYLDSAGTAPRAIVYLDPTNGSDANDGAASDRPVASLRQAFVELEQDLGATGRLDGGVVYVKQGNHPGGLLTASISQADLALFDATERWVTVKGDPAATTRPVIGRQIGNNYGSRSRLGG